MQDSFNSFQVQTFQIVLTYKKQNKPFIIIVLGYTSFMTMVPYIGENSIGYFFYTNRIH